MSRSRVDVIVHSSLSYSRENVAKVVGAISNEDFLDFYVLAARECRPRHCLRSVRPPSSVIRSLIQTDLVNPLTARAISMKKLSRNIR